jgi:hypothetical protein
MLRKITKHYDPLMFLVSRIRQVDVKPLDGLAHPGRCL